MIHTDGKPTIAQKASDAILEGEALAKQVPALASWELERSAYLKMQRALKTGSTVTLTNAENGALLLWIERAENAES